MKTLLCLLLAAAAIVAVPQVSLAQTAGEKIITLPEDGHVWATLVFTSDDWRSDHEQCEFLSWFNTNARLKKLVHQTKFYHYTPSSLIYQHKFAGIVKNQFPCVIVQTYEGTKVYKISGDNVPDSSDALANAISDKIKGVALRTDVDPAAHNIYKLAVFNRVHQRRERVDYSENPVRHGRYNDTYYQEAHVTDADQPHVFNLDQKFEAGRLFPRPKPDPTPCPGPNCPTPTPAVAPPVVDPHGHAPVLDDVSTDTHGGSHIPWWAVGLSFLVCSGLTMAVMYNKALTSR